MQNPDQSDSPITYGNVNLRVTAEERWAFKSWCAENRISQVDAFREAFALLRKSRTSLKDPSPQDDVDLLSMATVFMIDKEMALRLERRGKDAWAVCVEDHVVNTDRKIEYEPLPSSRDDAFIARTRFSLDAAIALSKTFLNNNISEG